MRDARRPPGPGDVDRPALSDVLLVQPTHHSLLPLRSLIAYTHELFKYTLNLDRYRQVSYTKMSEAFGDLLDLSRYVEL